MVPYNRGRESGRGRNAGQGNGQGAGPGGRCVCPRCGKKVSHQAGEPCSSLQCSQCKVPMIRG